MRTMLAALAFGLWAVPAMAGSPLQGRWDVVAPSDPGFSGEIIIDADGRATFWGASVTTQKSGRSRGYVSRLLETKAEITLGGGTEVTRIRCAIQSPDVLNCDDVATGRGGASSQYFMRRIGPGPQSLLTER